MNSKTLNRNFVFLIIGQALSMFGTVLLKFTVSLLGSVHIRASTMRAKKTKAKKITSSLS